MAGWLERGARRGIMNLLEGGLETQRKFIEKEKEKVTYLVQVIATSLLLMILARGGRDVDFM